MFKRALGVVMLGSCVFAPSSDGQERAPHAGSTAVGIDVGAFMPAESQFDNALIVNALLVPYVTPRVSLRTDFGLTDPGFSRESTDSLRQIPLRLDVNYNWEGGKWHPFVGAGAGGISCSSRTTGSRLANLKPNPGSTSAEASRLHRPDRLAQG